MLFPVADFQPEGLAAAIIEWSQKEFSIPPVAFATSFDPATNRFVFNWQSHQRPPGAEARRKRPARDLRGRPLPDE
ncbi:hypothetical protein [Streptomyces sp. WAC01526]|uniref:hypothetical protein n=1 Tax=Streptomyces sp. WAC01526 TaxID=2588709 RepID=UPI0011DF2ABF|nr:hypothetical protein [Streptomyces sp. WAC01526]